MFSETPNGVGRSVSFAEAHQAIGGLLADGKTICGVLRSHELAFLFGEEERDSVGSAAVVALSHQGLHGVLAIGSPDPQHYKVRSARCSSAISPKCSPAFCRVSPPRCGRFAKRLVSALIARSDA